MYANYKPQFDRDGRKKNLREGLPAYAYSRYSQYLPIYLTIVFLVGTYFFLDSYLSV